MAIKTRRYTIDDLAVRDDPRAEVPAEKTIRFAVDGAEYEIDLSAGNAEDFHERLRPYREAARRVGTRHSARPSANRQQTAKIRDWARENGFEVSNWGRLPAGLVARYKAAQGQLTPA